MEISNSESIVSFWKFKMTDEENKKISQAHENNHLVVFEVADYE